MASRAKKKGKKGIAIALIIIIVLGLLASLFFIRRGRLNNYLTDTAQTGSIETYYTFAGNVESKNTENVMSEKVAQISDILVKEGDTVKKDDVLFKTSQGDEVKAKIDGEIAAIYVEDEQSVMSGAKLCDIVDFDNLQITVKVDEYDLSCVEQGKQVDVNIGALDKDITGTVSSISKTATTQNGVSYFTATIDLQSDSGIKVGMSAEAKILNQRATDVLTLPMKALQFDDENKPYVLLRAQKGAPVMQYVTVGVNDGMTVEIKDGLTNGQEVLYPKTAASAQSGLRIGRSNSQNNSPSAAKQG